MPKIEFSTNDQLCGCHEEMASPLEPQGSAVLQEGGHFQATRVKQFVSPISSYPVYVMPDGNRSY